MALFDSNETDLELCRTDPLIEVQLRGRCNDDIHGHWRRVRKELSIAVAVPRTGYRLQQRGKPPFQLPALKIFLSDANLLRKTHRIQQRPRSTSERALVIFEEFFLTLKDPRCRIPCYLDPDGDLIVVLSMGASKSDGCNCVAIACPKRFREIRPVVPSSHQMATTLSWVDGAERPVIDADVFGRL